MCATACPAPGYYTLLAWLPSYFDLAMTAMTPFVGPIADGLVHKGWSVTNVRKLSQVRAFLWPPKGPLPAQPCSTPCMRHDLLPSPPRSPMRMDVLACMLLPMLLLP